MNIKDLTATPDTTEFYPTPPELIDKMLQGIDFDVAETFLEPSAGKGDIALAILKKRNNSYERRRDNDFSIDCIEIDPYLRNILKFNASEESIKSIKDEYRELGRKLRNDKTEEEKSREKYLRSIIDEHHNCENIRIVADDFLRFNTYKHYDYIIMNPPFSEGEMHLLKAIQMQVKNGGSICCILNAETIRNPYSNSRKLLLQKLQQYNAKVEYLKEQFSNAERKTDVEIALVSIDFPEEQMGSSILANLERDIEDRNIEEDVYESKEIVAGDFITQLVKEYEFEVEGTVRLIKEFKAMRPYMINTFNNDAYSKRSILQLKLSEKSYQSYDCVPINEYLKKVREKYWECLFNKEEFTGKLTSKLRDDYRSLLNDMINYEFNEFNIRQVFNDMMVNMCKGVEETILQLFDDMTAEHAWYPECSKNVHYYNGWQTNKAHKIGSKVIMPVNGMFGSYSWNKNNFDIRRAYEVLSDIEKSLNYLDGGMTEDVRLDFILQRAEQEKKTKNIHCKYFAVDFFKKGTMHIKFYPESMKLVDRFNIYASQKKGWLPPSYGQKSYSKMTQEEKDVIDSFQGEESYNEVMSHQEYYLVDVKNSILMLNA